MTVGKIYAQDIHFAHIHASPTYLNPAMTGMIDGGIIRFIANGRSQWNAFTNGYKTAAGSVDMKLINEKATIVGGGLQLSADVAGDLDFSTKQAALSFSVIKSFDRKSTHLFSVGVQSAFVSQSVDYSKMKGFETEPLVFEGAPGNINYWDLSAGMSWHYNLDRNNSMYLGVGYAHFNGADVSFSSRIAAHDRRYEYDIKSLYTKYTIHGGAALRMSRFVTSMPSFMIFDQGPHREINLGTFVKFNKSIAFTKSDYAFYIGAWYRWYAEKDLIGGDAMIVSLRADVFKTYFTVSYDVNLSTLTRASGGAGGPEISIVHILDIPEYGRKHAKVKCPAF